MSSSPPALPTPRQLLTSILSQISRIPAPDAPDPGDDTAQNSSSTVTRGADPFPFPERATGQPQANNPLRLIDPRHRPLFATLHVLFPSLLLPALDLLDRGLVTRLLGPLARQQDGDGPREARDPEGAPPTPPPALTVYLVRSAQKPARRPYGGDAPAAAASASAGSGGGNSGSGQRAYVVHTAAWNCTCAAFAFSAFPPLSGPSLLAPPAGGRGEDAVPAIITTTEDDGDGAEDRDRDGGRQGGPWQFGGFSFDGCADAGGGGGVPPCCKHLLACVLAERWQAGLDRFVNRWEVTREEMAGVFADV